MAWCWSATSSHALCRCGLVAGSYELGLLQALGPVHACRTARYAQPASIHPGRPCISTLQVMLTRPSHMVSGFDPDSIKGKAALVSEWRRCCMAQTCWQCKGSQTTLCLLCLCCTSEDLHVVLATCLIAPCVCTATLPLMLLLLAHPRRRMRRSTRCPRRSAGISCWPTPLWCVAAR